MLIKTDETLVPTDIAAAHSTANYFVCGLSPAMRSVERLIAEIAPTDIPVLITGESGTGKEIIALEIHRRSRRPQEAFLKCNCTSIAVESLTSRLSLTCGEGASDGYASVGTIFLDEVSQLDLATQRRLLQLLPEGDTPALRARLISSTTQNLEDQMRAGQFRDELYYRINGVCLRLPPLRHRAADIPVLLDSFLKKYAALFGRLEPHVGTATMDVLLRHPWPGNIRELENFARKMVALGDEQLALSDLPAHVSSVVSEISPVRVSPSISPGNGAGNGRSLKEAAREASRKTEHEMILRVLERTHWNRKRTARELQISYKALLYKLKQLGLNGDSEEPAR